MHYLWTLSISASSWHWGHTHSWKCILDYACEGQQNSISPTETNGAPYLTHSVTLQYYIMYLHFSLELGFLTLDFWMNNKTTTSIKRRPTMVESHCGSVTGLGWILTWLTSYINVQSGNCWGACGWSFNEAHYVLHSIPHFVGIAIVNLNINNTNFI